MMKVTTSMLAINLRTSFALCCLSLSLVACTSAPTKNEPVSQPSAQPSSPAPLKRGGYYLDDGPSDNLPADLDSIPNAVPKPEIVLAKNSRPYSALGQSYTPMTSYMPYKQRGIASWYGKRYHGQKTSSGEQYDMFQMTAAHTILPIPSYAKVTNPDNGRSVIVRINDRGPFHSDRIIDLSYAAAHKLDLIGKGSGLVEVEAINAQGDMPANTTSSSAVSVIPINPGASVAAPVALENKPYTPPPAAAIPPAPAKPATTSANKPGIYVQTGAFKSRENADNLISKLQSQKLAGNPAVNSWYNQGIYRVLIGPYSQRSEAERAAATIKQNLSLTTYIYIQP